MEKNKNKKQKAGPEARFPSLPACAAAAAAAAPQDGAVPIGDPAQEDSPPGSIPKGDPEKDGGPPKAEACSPPGSIPKDDPATEIGANVPEGWMGGFKADVNGLPLMFMRSSNGNITKYACTGNDYFYP